MADGSRCRETSFGRAKRGIAKNSSISESRVQKITKNDKERYKFQVKKGADDKTLKQLADKNSHKV